MCVDKCVDNVDFREKQLFPERNHQRKDYHGCQQDFLEKQILLPLEKVCPEDGHRDGHEQQFPGVFCGRKQHCEGRNHKTSHDQTHCVFLPLCFFEDENIIAKGP